MNISKNKIIMIAAGAFCLFALIFVGMQFTKKSQTGQVGKNGSPVKENSPIGAKEESPAACKAKIQKMNNEELVRYAMKIPDDGSKLNSDKVKKSDAANDLLARQMRCQYEKSSNEQEKSKILASVSPIFDRIAEKAGKETGAIAKESFKNPEESFTRSLALSDFTALCPDKLPGMCAKENNTLILESPEWCENVCTILANYKNNADVFNQEVMKFSNLDASIRDKFSAYVWRISLAFGLKGKAEALKMCNNLPEDIRYSCVRQMNSYEIRKMDCGSMAITEKLSTELCGN